MKGKRTSKLRILVVDDDEDVRSLLQLVLCNDGYSVTEAKDGVEALELFAPGRFDLVLTDCEMPGITGTELIQKIRSQASNQRIGLISGHVHNCREVLNAVNFHLDKPFQSDELSREVKRVLRLD